jgi:hypothetical protein
VLTAGSVMRPVADATPAIETAHGLLRLDGEGEATLDGRRIAVPELESGDATAGGGEARASPCGLGLWRCHAAMPLQRLVRAAARGQAGFLVTGGDGRVVGFIGERELFAAFLR